MPMGVKVGSAYVELALVGQQKFSAGMRRTKIDFLGIAGSLGALSVAIYAVNRALWAVVRSTSLAAGAAEEAANRFRVTFGKVGESVRAWSKDFAAATGLVARSLRVQAADFGAMLNAMGFTEGAAAKLSPVMVQLGTDISSLYDKPLQQAFDAMRSALVGQTRPIRAFGSDVTEATMKEFALAHGIRKSVEQMGFQEKALLRLRIIVQQQTKAHGDFIRTQTSFMNTLKIVGDQFLELKTVFGGFIVGAINPLLQQIKTLLTWMTAFLRVIQEYAPVLATVIGAFTILAATMMTLALATVITGAAVAALAAVFAKAGPIIIAMLTSIRLLTLDMALLAFGIGAIVYGLMKMMGATTILTDFTEDMKKALAEVNAEMEKQIKLSDTLAGKMRTLSSLGVAAWKTMASTARAVTTSTRQMMMMPEAGGPLTNIPPGKPTPGVRVPWSPRMMIDYKALRHIEEMKRRPQFGPGPPGLREFMPGGEIAGLRGDMYEHMNHLEQALLGAATYA